MTDRSSLSLRRFVLLLVVGLLFTATVACSGSPAGQTSATAPSVQDQLARRIVAGQGGELYYTDDHYDSFKRVVP